MVPPVNLIVYSPDMYVHAAVCFGLFHYLLLCACGWADASDAVEILSVSFLMPHAKEDMNLHSFELGLLGASIFLGMMIGSYFWGSLADIRGRKAVLVYSLLMNGIFGLLSSFMQSFWPFLLMRFLSGIGVGGSMPVIFSYFCEFLPKNRRGAMLTLISMFWILGNIITAGLAWAIIPRHFGYFSDTFTYDSWRIFVAVCTIPSFTSSFTFVFLPESPKFLLENGEETVALSVLRKMYILNNRSKQKADFPVQLLQASPEARKLLQTRHSRKTLRSLLSQCKKNCREIFTSTRKLFVPPHRKVSVCLLTIIFTLSFGYYGVWLWFPEIFKRVEVSGSACSVLPANLTSNSSDTDSSIYRDSFITAVSNFPGNLFATLTIDKLGRKALLGGSLLVSGCSVFFIWFLSSRAEVLAMSCIFGGISVIGWAALNVIGVECYPTNMRATAVGMQSVVNRIAAITGNLVFGVFIDLYCAVPILAVAVLLAFGGIITVFLPNTKGMDLK
ncbi:synaptic vesicle glycoprotein 2C-like isoform X2 [Ptychodera flava]|uniref:synaptic vesicle glycoprotein 2C-like isoform X2 n=1 Tax=Ptychodera flava TaxID=63121 RepID=UPI00396A27AD